MTRDHWHVRERFRHVSSRAHDLVYEVIAPNGTVAVDTFDDRAMADALVAFRNREVTL